MCAPRALLMCAPRMETGRPCGTLLLIDVEDRAAAEGFAATDPYARAGLFESTVIRAYRTVLRDGEVVA